MGRVNESVKGSEPIKGGPKCAPWSWSAQSNGWIKRRPRLCTLQKIRRSEFRSLLTRWSKQSPALVNLFKVLHWLSLAMVVDALLQVPRPRAHNINNVSRRLSSINGTHTSTGSEKCINIVWFSIGPKGKWQQISLKFKCMHFVLFKVLNNTCKRLFMREIIKSALHC